MLNASSSISVLQEQLNTLQQIINQYNHQYLILEQLSVSDTKYDRS